MNKVLVAVGAVALVTLNVFIVVTFVLPIVHEWSPRDHQPLPTGAAIEAPRRKANQDITRLFGDIDRYCAQTGIRYYDTGTFDHCEMGRHDMWVDTRWENRCRYLMAEYYGFGRDFRATMLQLDSALVASGWKRDAGGIPSRLTGYYDPHFGADRPQPPRSAGPFLVQNIPSASYTRDTFRLMIRSQEPDSTGKAFVLPFEYVSAMSRDLSYDEVHAAKLDSLGSIIFARNRYMLVIGILRDDYFVN